MTTGPDELTWVQICRARATLRQHVEDGLRGSGLQIRELAAHLTIHNPDDPDKGRVYITYASGDVSCRCITWEYLGSLQGYDGDDPDREPGVDATAIIATLTGQPTPPA